MTITITYPNQTEKLTLKTVSFVQFLNDGSCRIEFEHGYSETFTKEEYTDIIIEKE